MLFVFLVLLAVVLIVGAIWLFDLERRVKSLEVARRLGVAPDIAGRSE